MQSRASDRPVRRAWPTIAITRAEAAKAISADDGTRLTARATSLCTAPRNATLRVRKSKRYLLAGFPPLSVRAMIGLNVLPGKSAKYRWIDPFRPLPLKSVPSRVLYTPEFACISGTSFAFSKWGCCQGNSFFAKVSAFSIDRSFSQCP
jgi:hypothetical protein